jgi:tetratricopeptide (TPR) repeat protein
MRTAPAGTTLAAVAWAAWALLWPAGPARGDGPVAPAPAIAPVPPAQASRAPGASPSATPAAGADELARLWSSGESAYESGDLDEALRLFTEALAIDPRRARTWNYVGGVHFARGDAARALQDFGRALDLDPRDVRAANNVGTALERLGELARAEEAYLRAARIDPAYAPTQRNLGIVRSRLGDAAGARAAWERYLDLAPSGDHAAEVRRALAELGADKPAGAPAAAPVPEPPAAATPPR